MGVGDSECNVKNIFIYTLRLNYSELLKICKQASALIPLVNSTGAAL